MYAGGLALAERSVHLAVRGLVTGVAAEAAPRGEAPVGRAVKVGPFEVGLEVARPRILPGEENELTVTWKALVEGARAEVQVVLDLPAEVSAPEAERSARALWGEAGGAGLSRFRVRGEEPGGVWVDALLTLEDEAGVVLGRTRAGFALARHRVVISAVDVEPPVVAPGGAFKVAARYAWTGQERVRGTLGGTLRRRADGAQLELRREKVSALGERTQEWALKAPVDFEVADFDVEMTFEGREEGQKANFGRTGVLAVRRLEEAEVAGLEAAAARWGTAEPVEVKVRVRNTGVRPLAGAVRLEVFARAPGAPEAEALEGAAAPESVALEVPTAGSAEAAFRVTLPKGVEGRRVEGRAEAVFGGTRAEKREVLGHAVADHALEFDGFAADRYAFSAGEEAQVECRLRDDGAKPGGRFEVALRLLDGSREIAKGEAAATLEGRVAVVRARLKLPEGLEASLPLDLEVAVPAENAVRLVKGFLRVRQKVALGVVVAKPPFVEGEAAFLFEGEKVARADELGEVTGLGRARLVELDTGAFFVEGPGGLPVVGPEDVLERALAKALVKRGGSPRAQAHGRAWQKLHAAPKQAGARPGVQGALRTPSSLAREGGQGPRFKALALRAEGPLGDALELTGAAFGGSRMPASELANLWVAAAEGAGGKGDGEPSALGEVAAVREREARGLHELAAGGLDAGGVAALGEDAVLRRALEAQALSEALKAGGNDLVLETSAALKAVQEQLRESARYFARLGSAQRAGAEAAKGEGRLRRALAALRVAKVEVRGADGILPGRYSKVEIAFALPEEAPSGGSVAAAVALPSELWIVGSESATLLRGQYLLPAQDVVPGGRAAWPLELYVPDRAGGERGSIEVRVGFEGPAEAPRAVGGPPR